MRWLAAIFSLAVLVRPAEARPSSEALEHYKRAVAFVQQGDRRTAIAEFEEAFKWSSDPIMLYNIATQYKELAAAAPGATSEEVKRAIEYYKRYLAAVPRDKERARLLAWIASAEANTARQPAVSKTATAEPPTSSTSSPASTNPALPAPSKGGTPPPPAKKVAGTATPIASASRPAETATPPPSARSKEPPPPSHEAREVLDADELPDFPVVKRIETPPPVVVHTEAPQPVPDASGSRRKLRVLEAALGTGIGLGLGGIAAGAAMLYLDGRGTCTLATPAVQCPEVYDTSTAGLALVASGGAVALGTAAALLYMELERRRAERPVAIAPWVGGNTFGVSALGAF